jgi:hypothetical protein
MRARLPIAAASVEATASTTARRRNVVQPMAAFM